MSTELVAVELQLKGYEGVMSDMRALDQMLNSFRGRQNKITLQADLQNVKTEILALQGELNKLRQVKNILSEKGLKSEGLEKKIKQMLRHTAGNSAGERQLLFSCTYKVCH